MFNLKMRFERLKKSGQDAFFVEVSREGILDKKN
jgi:hypothetical protein